MREIEIKDMKPTHFEGVETLDLRTENEQGTTFIAEELDEMFDDTGVSFATYHGRVALCHGEVIGYIIWVHSEIAGVGIQAIFNINVHPDYRREGVGTQLVDEIDEKVAAIIVETDEDAYALLNFWSKCKFVVQRIDPALYDGEEMIHKSQFILRKEPRKQLTLHNRMKWRAN